MARARADSYFFRIATLLQHFKQCQEALTKDNDESDESGDEEYSAGMF